MLLSGQVLSRRAGDIYSGSLDVDFALVDWNISNTSDNSLGVMAGRIKNSLGLYNGTRDVAFTRPGVFVPKQIDFDSVRNLVPSADGVQLYVPRTAGSGNSAFKLGAGTDLLDKNVEIACPSRDFGGDLDAEGVSCGIERGQGKTGFLGGADRPD